VAARGVTATGEADTGAITRAELAAVQRDLIAARTGANQAAAELRGTPPGSGGEDAIGACARFGYAEPPSGRGPPGPVQFTKTGPKRDVAIYDAEKNAVEKQSEAPDNRSNG
jgi:hypothetical protein